MTKVTGNNTILWHWSVTVDQKQTEKYISHRFVKVCFLDFLYGKSPKLEDQQGMPIHFDLEVWEILFFKLVVNNTLGDKHHWDISNHSKMDLIQHLIILCHKILNPHSVLSLDQEMKTLLMGIFFGPSSIILYYTMKYEYVKKPCRKFKQFIRIFSSSWSKKVWGSFT